MSSTNFPPILVKGIKYLKYLESIDIPGYGIIPIKIVNNSKVPMVSFKDNNENIHRVNDTFYLSQWSQAEFYGVVLNPNHNPNITKQMFVVDIDIPTKGGHSNDGSLHMDKLDLTSTFTVLTRSGGLHFIYTAPLGTKLLRQPFNGIDIVCNSPTYHIGVGSPNYKLHNKTNIQPASDKLLEQLKWAPTVKVDDDKTSNSILGDIMANGVASGKRHDTIVKLMASLAVRRIRKEEALVIAQMAIDKCDQSKGLPTIVEAEAQYADAVNKFVGDQDTYEDLLKNKVLISSTTTVADLTHAHKTPVPMASFNLMYSSVEPNMNRKLNAQGDFFVDKISKIWTDSKDKLVVDDVGYLPSDEPIFSNTEGKFINKYLAPKFDLSIDTDELLIKKFQTVFKRTFGPIYNDWLKVIKYKYLNPHVKFSWCIYVTSVQEGTGKGLSWKFTEAIFGRNNCLSINSVDIGQRFNASLSECTFVLVDEAHGGTTRAVRNSQMNSLNKLITEYSMTIEGKGKEKSMGVSSHFFMYIFSNDRASIDMHSKSRRFLVYHDEASKTPAEINRMKEMGALLDGPDNIRVILKWIMDTVSIEESELFTPKGEARRTDDLESADDDAYESPELYKVSQDIEEGNDIFKSDLITIRQLEYYVTMEFGFKSHKVMQDLTGRLSDHNKLLRKLPQGDTRFRRFNYFSPNKSLAKEGIHIRDTYDSVKRQSAVLVVRNYDDYAQMASTALSNALKEHISANGPRARGKITSV